MTEKVDAEGEYIKAPGEIARLLGRVQTQLSPVTVRFPGVQRALTTYIAGVDPKRRYVLLDEVLPKSDARMIKDGRTFNLETYYEGCRLRARNLYARESKDSDGNVIYRIPFPDEVHYLQRRAAYRAQVRRSLEIPARIMDADRQVLTGLLRDMSAEGCQIQVPGDVSERLKAHGKTLVPIKIYFPNGTSLVAKVELRFVGYDEHGGYTKCGCQFEELDAQKEQQIARIVTDLQRDYINFTKNGGKIEGVPALFLPPEEDDDIAEMDREGRPSSGEMNAEAEKSAKESRRKRRTERQPKLEVKQVHSEAIGAIKSLIGRVRLEQALPVDELRESAANLVTVWQQNREQLILTTHMRNLSDYLFEHPVGMAVLLTDQAARMQLATSGDELQNVMMAGLCHDVAKAMLEDGEKETGIDVSPAKREPLRQQIMRYRALLKADDRLPELVPRLAAQNFEREDGSGLPDGLKGNDLDAMAKLAIAVDMIDSGAHIYREDVYYHPAMAYKRLLGMSDRISDSVIKQVVVGQGLFPLGSPVRLSDQTAGLVMRQSDNRQPTVVRVIYNLKEQSPRMPRDITLSDAGVRIEGPVDPIRLGISNTLLQAPLQVD